MKGKKKLVIVLIALLAAGIYYYAALPAVNLHSSETWFAALILLVIRLLTRHRRPGVPPRPSGKAPSSDQNQPPKQG